MVFSFLRFYSRRLFAVHPALFFVLIVSILGVISGGMLNYQQSVQLEQARGDMAIAFKAEEGHGAKAPPASHGGGPAVELPAFDSVVLVHTLNDQARDLGLQVDEVTYALDSGATTPYMRYRVALRVSDEYLRIRDFGARLASQLSNISMDSISCTRSDTGAKSVTCEMQLSAFYRRAVSGQLR